MSALSIRHLQQAQVLTALSKRRYLLTEQASTHHQHVWLASSESDGGQFNLKSSLRAKDSEQSEAIRQLNTEMTILKGPLRNAQGIRQLVDQIALMAGGEEQTRAGVFKHLDCDFHRYHLAQKHKFSRRQAKSIARQILTALSNTHKQDIVHTDIKLENIVSSQSASPTTSDILVKIIDFGVASQPGEDRCRMITNPYWRSPESWVGIPWGTATDIWSFGAVIGSLLMEPGAKLFQPMGGLAGVPTDEQDREFLRSLWTMIPFPKTFLKRAPRRWQDEISRFSPRLAPTGAPITLSFVGELFEVPRADWEFVGDILQVDPDTRPTADELLQHT
ncbi:kinase-like domain-containing protein [Leptodontidium sp. 2 PMI_412]|nr:kinase-like domain-containing protein [Leptodontidium sp. MPI-SDFR-AT-0119]KAH9218030.1 kinase-like domain-containing protein [Leptodontidium sp. 2 PMI_412]